MTRFADTPKSKRGKWNPETKRMEYPAKRPTRAQSALLEHLAREAGVPVPRPRTREAASREIDRLKR